MNLSRTSPTATTTPPFKQSNRRTKAIFTSGKKFPRKFRQTSPFPTAYRHYRRRLRMNFLRHSNYSLFVGLFVVVNLFTRLSHVRSSCGHDAESIFHFPHRRERALWENSILSPFEWVYSASSGRAVASLQRAVWEIHQFAVCRRLESFGNCVYGTFSQFVFSFSRSRRRWIEVFFRGGKSNRWFGLH